MFVSLSMVVLLPPATQSSSDATDFSGVDSTPLGMTLIVCGGSAAGLGELCSNHPVLCYANNSWKCNYYAPEFDMLCSIIQW